MILLTSRFYGMSDDYEVTTQGVFSSLDKAKEMALADVGGVIGKESDGYFEIRCGSGYTYDYDWIEIELDKII